LEDTLFLEINFGTGSKAVFDEELIVLVEWPLLLEEPDMKKNAAMTM
jgi:hypothetical protein